MIMFFNKIFMLQILIHFQNVHRILIAHLMKLVLMNYVKIHVSVRNVVWTRSVSLSIIIQPVIVSKTSREIHKYNVLDVSWDELFIWEDDNIIHNDNFIQKI